LRLPGNLATENNNQHLSAITLKQLFTMDTQNFLKPFFVLVIVCEILFLCGLVMSDPLQKDTPAQEPHNVQISAHSPKIYRKLASS
jgi:hypothetical protein